MKKLICKRQFAYKGKSYYKGSLIECEVKEAESLIAKGLCEAIQEPKPVPAPAPIKAETKELKVKRVPKPKTK